MGNCFSSGKAASPANEPAPVQREKPGSLPHIEATDGKLRTSDEIASETPKDTTQSAEAPKGNTLDPETSSPQDQKSSEVIDSREPPKTPPQKGTDEAAKRESGSATVDSGKGMSANDSLKESTAEPVEEEKPDVPEKAASRQESISSVPIVTTSAECAETPTVPEQAEPATAPAEAETSVAKSEEAPATTEKEEPVVSETQHTPAATENATVPIATSSEETRAPVESNEAAEAPPATPTTVEDANPQTPPETKATEIKPIPALPQLNTTLPPSSAVTKDVPATTATTISPSSLKSPETALTHQETAQTTPPSSARPMTSSSSKGGLSLFPAETKHEPPASPVAVPITPQNTATDPAAPHPGIPSRTQSTTEKVDKGSPKRQSRISRMFSKKDKGGDLPLRTTSLIGGKKQATISEKKEIPPVPPLNITSVQNAAPATEKTSAKKDRPLSKGSKTSATESAPLSAATDKEATELVSPTVEGRKWNQEGDNDSLYCY